MNNNLIKFLVPTLLICANIYGALDKKVTSSSKEVIENPLLTTQQIIDGFNKGVETGATHMLVVWDTYDFDDTYNFIEYVYPDKNVTDVIKYYDAPGYYRVSAVFAMHLDINQQLEGSHWYPEYP